LSAREFWIFLEFHRKNCEYFGRKREGKTKTKINEIKHLQFFARAATVPCRLLLPPIVAPNQERVCKKKKYTYEEIGYALYLT